MKNLVLAISVVILMILLCTACSHKVEIVEIKVINEMQPCEENNIFYRIISAPQNISLLKTKRDSLVLLLLDELIRTNENYQLFFPEVTTHRYEFELKGYFLKNKVEANNTYGCPGSNRFKIIQIKSIKDVTNTNDFPISN